MEKEYDMLRKEIEQNSSVINNYLTFLYPAMGVMLAYIVSNFNNSLIFSAMYLIIVPIAARIRSLNNSTVRLAAYMIVFLEPGITGFCYETRNYLRIYLKANRNSKVNNAISLFFLNINGATFFIGLATYVLYIYILVKKFDMTNLLIGGIINTLSMLILTYFLVKDFRSHTDKAEYVKSWEQIKNSQ